MKTVEMPKLDITPYVGTKTEIADAQVINAKFGKAIKVETAVIPLQGNDKLPEGKNLKASVILGLVELESGELAIGKDTKADLFCKNHKIDVSVIPDGITVGSVLSCFIGKKVVCQKNEAGYLTIA